MTVNCKGSRSPLTTPISLRKSIEDMIIQEIKDKYSSRLNSDDIIDTTSCVHLNLPHFSSEYRFC